MDHVQQDIALINDVLDELATPAHIDPAMLGKPLPFPGSKQCYPDFLKCYYEMVVQSVPDEMNAVAGNLVNEINSYVEKEGNVLSRISRKLNNCAAENIKTDIANLTVNKVKEVILDNKPARPFTPKFDKVLFEFNNLMEAFVSQFEAALKMSVEENVESSSGDLVNTDNNSLSSCTLSDDMALSTLNTFEETIDKLSEAFVRQRSEINDFLQRL